MKKDRHKHLNEIQENMNKQLNEMRKTVKDMKGELNKVRENPLKKSN
jgi:signal transduction histidine kinase